MRYISASDMHSKDSNEFLVTSNKLKAFLFFTWCLLLVTCYSLLVTSFCHAEIIDRVVAFVDEEAITLSELEETYENIKKVDASITREEVLKTMINRILLLREAKKLRIEAPTEDDLLHEYIDLKVRTFIKVKEEDIGDFYNRNRAEFKGMEFDAVRDKIESYLLEKEVNLRLKRHIEDLRSKAHIKAQL